LRRRGY